MRVSLVQNVAETLLTSHPDRNTRGQVARTGKCLQDVGWEGLHLAPGDRPPPVWKEVLRAVGRNQILRSMGTQFFQDAVSNTIIVLLDIIHHPVFI
jgi:hypothetical protein